jgi:DNA recombination protein RmuC
LQYQKETRELQGSQIRDLSAVNEQLKSLACAQLSLQNETARLVNALKSPQVRGRWGQVQLRRLLELSGMSLHCDFTEEFSVTTRLGRLRPDMVVHLPSDREVVVDAKVPLSAYLEALEALTEADKRAALHKHVLQIREHLRCLSGKQYWEQFSFTPEFVVMFIPNDSFLSAAAEIDPELIEAALERNVILATPSTLIPLLKAIAFGWRQEKATESAQRIRQLGEELSDRLVVFVDHLRKLGLSLSRSVEGYNAAVRALESRVLVSARRFRELGAAGSAEIAEAEPVDVVPRAVSSSVGATKP